MRRPRDIIDETPVSPVYTTSVYMRVPASSENCTDTRRRRRRPNISKSISITDSSFCFFFLSSSFLYSYSSYSRHQYYNSIIIYVYAAVLSADERCCDILEMKKKIWFEMWLVVYLHGIIIIIIYWVLFQSAFYHRKLKTSRNRSENPSVYASRPITSKSTETLLR